MKNSQNKNINDRLIIAIIDEDKFYTAGLVIALSLHLKTRGINANFHFDGKYERNADIVFQAVRSGTCLLTDCHIPKASGKPIYFFITERKDTHLQHLYRDIKKCTILYRHQSVGTLLQYIGTILFSQQRSYEKERPEPNKKLTVREQEVLHHLGQGKTPAGAASCMGIKEKTISSHKRAAMKKLNFKRSNELFHWMLQGGLLRHPPRKGS
ncbi:MULTISPECIES: response regulator transcription factor [Serratia]|uniref:response regulator transcription factor n=1 Tax=Serratia TaxID=613 RepID=UPI0014956B0D|nr:helix-turn-helix transcriptional regulator [Serratia marcescens]CAI0920705.1 two component system sensor kinase SsrB [Serratia marcescens]